MQILIENQKNQRYIHYSNL